MDRPHLRKVRRDAGLLQRDMAERLGISLSHYKNIEAGFQNPSYELLETFARKFPRYQKRVWQVFQKEEKRKPVGTKIPIKIDPNFVEEVVVETDWGQK